MSAGGIAVAGRQFWEVRTTDWAYGGDPQVDPFDLLAGVGTEVVAVERTVGVVEGVGDRRVERRISQVWHGDADLEGLAEVAEVGGPDQALVVRREALAGQAV